MDQFVALKQVGCAKRCAQARGRHESEVGQLRAAEAEFAENAGWASRGAILNGYRVIGGTLRIIIRWGKQRAKIDRRHGVGGNCGKAVKLLKA
jgi:hypothetical protein